MDHNYYLMNTLVSSMFQADDSHNDTSPAALLWHNFPPAAPFVSPPEQDFLFATMDGALHVPSLSSEQSAPNQPSHVPTLDPLPQQQRQQLHHLQSQQQQQQTLQTQQTLPTGPFSSAPLLHTPFANTTAAPIIAQPPLNGPFPFLLQQSLDDPISLPPISSWDDSFDTAALDNATPSRVFDEDADLLVDIAGGEFSSPSTYPSFTNPPQATISTPDHYQAPAPNPSSAAPRYSNCSSAHSLFDYSVPSRTDTQLPTSTPNLGESQNTVSSNDYLDYINDPFDSPASLTSDTMPPSLRRNRAPPVAISPLSDARHTSKRRRTAAQANALPGLRHSPSEREKKPVAIQDSDDSIFDDRPSQVAEPGSEDIATIDLTETDEIPTEASTPTKKSEPDRRIKIGNFQCAICMDDAKNITLTHCGHLFCAECLHSALQVETTRGKCPMCRQKIDMRPRESYTSKTKGYYPLELKLMTSTRKGKRKATNIS